MLIYWQNSFIFNSLAGPKNIELRKTFLGMHICQNNSYLTDCIFEICIKKIGILIKSDKNNKYT